MSICLSYIFNGYVFIETTGASGIDLGAIGETYNELGFSAIIYPQLDMQSYINSMQSLSMGGSKGG